MPHAQTVSQQQVHSQLPTSAGNVAELSMGWVDPWVGLGWVEIFQFLVGWVGLGPL